MFVPVYDYVHMNSVAYGEEKKRRKKTTKDLATPELGVTIVWAARSEYHVKIFMKEDLQK